VLIRGEKGQLDRVLDQVERRFEGIGWIRDTSREAQMTRKEHPHDRFYCWSNGPNARPQVLLCLNRASDRRIRGATYTADQRAGVAELADAIQHVLKEVIEPAVADAGLTVSYPHLGPISRVGMKTELAMTSLAEAVDGQWPLPDVVEPIWRKFVVTALRDGVAIHPEELTSWFIANGWDERGAQELTKRFYADAALLEEYEQESQPA
jgi:hypothetical protein